jgi:hypothetical protein
MDLISNLYEAFSGQNLGRPKKTIKSKAAGNNNKKKNAASVSSAQLKSPQKARVVKKVPKKSPLTGTLRANLKSITNKPTPPMKRTPVVVAKKKSDEKKETTTSLIQSALAKGENIVPLMEKIERKKRAVLLQIEALEREVKNKKAEVVEMEKELLLGASSW